MEQHSQAQPPQAQPVGSHQYLNDSSHVIESPLWITVIRALQFIFAVIILGLCAWAIHGAYLTSEGLAIAVCVFTWLIVAYIVLAEKLPSLQGLYHPFVILALDGFLVIMWLSTMAYNASTRAKFKVRVKVGNCYNNGRLVNSHFCDVIGKRADENVLLSGKGMDNMIAIACLSALQFILFTVTLVIFALAFLKQRNSSAHPAGTEAAYSADAKHQPYVAPQQQQFAPQFTGQQQYPLSQAPQYTQQQYPVSQSPPPQGIPPQYPVQSGPYVVSPPVSPPPQELYQSPPKQ